MTVTGGGTFAVNAGGASGTVSLSGPVTIDGNSTLKITSPNQQFLGSTTIGSGSRFVLDTNGVLRSISSSGGTNNTYSGAGFFELRDGAIFTASGNGANTAVISAPVTLSGTTAYFGATNTNSMSITGGIGGTGAIVFASTISANGGGAGIVNVGGTGTYAGNSIINNAASGAVRIVNDNALSTASGAVWGNGGTSNVGFLDLNGSSQQFASIATNLGGTATAGGIVNSSATGSTLTISGSATTTFAAPIGAVVTENVGGGNTLSTNTNVSLVLNAANTGTLHLTGASPYTGSTIINGGTLAVDGALSGTSGISVGSGGTLAGVGAVNAAATVALAGGALAMSGGSVGAVHVTADSSWSGSATAASITVDSGKTLNMSGTATVTTEIDVAGSRLVNNGTLHATVDVTAGGVVHGSGSFDTLNVGNGGSVSPGNSPGTMTSANTTWDNGGTYVWEINHLGSSFGDQTPAGTDPGWDKWDAGLLTIHSGFTVDVTSLTAGNSAGLLSGFDPSSSYEWLIATRTSGDFASDLGSIGLNLSGFANSYSGTFSLASGGGGSELFLDYTYTAVPEPGTLLLGFLATSSFAWRLRRRSTRVADTLGDETSLDA
jgi:autotransporter-associated beta strand protein